MEACADILLARGKPCKNLKEAAENFRALLNYEEIFGNSNPVHLEIGCGKGKFICEKAAANPAVNFVAVEKISNVLVEALERAKSEKLKNVYFLNCAAEVLQKYFDEGAISVIYLNFSNPLPKEGYKKQRLTHPKFLKIYKNLLCAGGRIIQKTDDKDFYLFSLESLKSEGFSIVSVCENLAGNPVEGDVETEHERLFKDRGKAIYRIEAVKE